MINNLNNKNISAWSCIPDVKTENEYAIFFSISDSYSFAAANMIMGLYEHSPKLMEKTDIVIYHNGISLENVQLLLNLHKYIHFVEMTFPESWNALMNHPRTTQWGSFVICKLYGFFLINQYKKVLGLDVDMLITGDISGLFETDAAIAWRRVVIWKATELFGNLLSNKDDFISGPSGGMIFFSEKIKNYGITPDDIAAAFELVKDLKIDGSKAVNGGNDERILAWVVYDKKIPLKELDIHEYNTTIQNITSETKIVHFLKYRSAETKPWKNLASYLYFVDWANNYQHWKNMGGEGPVNFTSEDYYKLFGFDIRGKLEKQNKRNAELEAENKKLKKENKSIRNSLSWKLTKPFREIANKLRTLKKKVKACFKK